MSNEKVTIQVNPSKKANKAKRNKRKNNAARPSARRKSASRGASLSGRASGQLVALTPESERASMQYTVAKLRNAARSFPISAAAKATVAYYADPLSNRPVLYCGPFANRKVARAAVHNVAAAGFNSDAVDPKPNAQLPLSSSVMCVFRDIRRSVVRYLPCAVDNPWTLNFFSQEGNVSKGQGTALQVQPGEFPNWSYATCTSSSLNPVFHGGVQWAGTHNGKNYFWVDCASDNDADLSITFATVGVPYTIKICRLYDGEEQTRNQTRTANGAGVTSFTLTDIGNSEGFGTFGSGYYTFCVVEVNGAAFDYTTMSNIDVVGTADVFSHEALPGLFDISNAITQARVVALSGMYSNTAAPVNRQGKIAAFQAPGSSCWEGHCLYQNGGNSIYTELAPLQDATIWPADKGVYGFARPSQIEDFKFRDINSGDNTHFAADYIPYEICQESDYLIIAPEITSADGRDGTWIAVHAIEYVTTSQFIPMLMPTAHTAEHEAATSAMMNLEQWHENPKHISEIKNFVRLLSAPAKGLVNMAGSIDTPLSPLFKTLGKGISALESIF